MPEAIEKMTAQRAADNDAGRSGAGGLSRRLALFCAGATGLAGVPAAGLAAGAVPDAEVIRAAAAVERAEAAIIAAYEPPAETWEEDRAREPLISRLADERDDCMGALSALRATTLAGLIAKARAAYAMAPDKDRDTGHIVSNDIGDQIAFEIVEDLLALGGDDRFA
jgi:hypothetical protein